VEVKEVQVAVEVKEVQVAVEVKEVQAEAEMKDSIRFMSHSWSSVFCLEL
jgi:hypothetical protein